MDNITPPTLPSKKEEHHSHKKQFLIVLSVIFALIILFSVIFIFSKPSEITTLQIYEGENDVVGEEVSVDFENPIREITVEKPVEILESKPSIEIKNPEKTDFKSVAGYYDGPTPTGMFITTDVVAVESMQIEKAVIQLPKRGQVDFILRCADFDLDKFTCSGWEQIDIFFEDKGDYIEFQVNEFSAYAGASITIINVQSYPTVGGEWEVRFTTEGTADLIIEAIDGTTWSNSNENEDLKLLEIKCGGTVQDYTWENNKAIVTDYTCAEEGTEVSKVLTEGEHHLMFTFGGDVGYANNFAYTDSYNINLADIKFTGGQQSDAIGNAGDVDGDGYDDFLVADPHDDTGGPNAGEVFLHYGPLTTGSYSIGSGDASWYGEDQYSYGDNWTANLLGQSLGGIGDINNDGYDDFIIVSRTNAFTNISGYGRMVGRAYLFYGSATRFSGSVRVNESDYNASFYGYGDQDNLGWNMGSLGDVNNDTYDDFFLVGQNDVPSSLDSSTADHRGRTYLIYGKNDSFSGDYNITNTYNASWAGEGDGHYARIVTYGDINGDDYSDIIIAATHHNWPANTDGKMYLIYGQTTPYSGAKSLSTANASWIGEAGVFGYSIASDGLTDITGDGYDDILIGAPYVGEGKLYSVFGQSIPYSSQNIPISSNANATWNATEPGDVFTRSDFVSADFNNDGIGDIAVPDSWSDSNSVNQSGEVYVIYGPVAHGTHAYINESFNASWFSLTQNEKLGYSDQYPFAMTKGDFDGDGSDDFAVNAPYTTKTTYMILGNSTTVGIGCPKTLEANTNYIMTEDASIPSGNCFTINGDNVVLDCQGHSISGPATTGTAIYSAVNRNNFELKNCWIQDFQYGVYRFFSDSVFLNNTFNSTYYKAITLSSYDNNNITSNTFMNSEYMYYPALDLSSSDNNNVYYNNFTSNTGYDLQVTSSSGNDIKHNIFDKNSIDNRVFYFSTSSGATVENNTITNVGTGSNSWGYYFSSIKLQINFAGTNLVDGENASKYFIYNKSNLVFENLNRNFSTRVLNLANLALYQVDNVTIKNSNFSEHSAYQVRMQDVTNITIENNNVSKASGTGYGIRVSQFKNLEIKNNSIKADTNPVIDLYVESTDASQDAVIEHNTISCGSGDGIQLKKPSTTGDAKNITIQHNTGSCTSTSGYFVLLDVATYGNTFYNITVYNNTVSGGGSTAGIYSENPYTNITNNTISNCGSGSGITPLGRGDYQTIYGNTISNCRYGLYLASEYNNISKNNLTDNSNWGIYVTTEFRNNISHDNLINGKEPYYYYKEPGAVIENLNLNITQGVSSGVVTVVDSSGVTIRNNELMGSGASTTTRTHGIGLYNVSDSSITNNTINKSECSIYASGQTYGYDFNNNTIENNTFNANLGNYQIYLNHGAKNNTIKNNHFYNGKSYGVGLDSTYVANSVRNNTIANNDFRNHSQSIYLVSTQYNTIENNTIDQCTMYGLGLYYSSQYNIIRYNNFTNFTGTGAAACLGCGGSNAHGVIENKFYNNYINGTYYGIKWDDSYQNNTAYNNEIYHTSSYALMFDPDKYEQNVYNNTICYNKYAILFSTGRTFTNVKVHNNSFCIINLWPVNGSNTTDSTPLLSFNASNIFGTNCTAVIDGIGSGINASMGPDNSNQTIQVNRTLSAGFHELNYTCTDNYDSSAEPNSITFEVTQGTPCGIDPITTSTTLTQNYTATLVGDCISITANNTILDCAGYSLTGLNTNNGISTSDTQNVTVENCIISNFSVGINATDVNNFTVNNTNISNVDWGIYIDPSDDVVIEEIEVKNANEGGVGLEDSGVVINGLKVYEDTSPSKTKIGIYIVQNLPFEKIATVNGSNLTVTKGTGIKAVSNGSGNGTVACNNDTIKAQHGFNATNTTVNITNSTIYATGTGIILEDSSFFIEGLTIDISGSTDPGATGIEIDGDDDEEPEWFPNADWSIILPTIGGTGIKLFNMGEFDINNVDIDGQGNGTGINATNSTNVTITNTNITGVDFGIITEDSSLFFSGLIIDLSSSTEPDATGIECGAVPWCGHCKGNSDTKVTTIELPTIGGTGIKLFNMGEFDINNVDIDGNGNGTGINATNSTNVTISNTNITGVDIGISIEDADNSEISNTVIGSGGGAKFFPGARITSSNKVDFINFTLVSDGDGTGINVTNSTNITMNDSRVESLDYGLYIDSDSSDITLNNNKFRCSNIYDIYNEGSATGDNNYCGLTYNYVDTTNSYWYSDSCTYQPSDCNEPLWRSIPGFDDSVSTSIGGVNDMSAVALILGSSGAKIAWSSTVDAQNEDYDSNIALGSDFVSIDSSNLDSSINTAGNVTFSGIDCDAFNIYHIGSGLYTSGSSLRAAGDVVADESNVSGNCDAGACSNIACSSGTLTFEVSGWSGYSVVNNTHLTIWDDTDTQTKYPTESIGFFANYSNATSGPILGAVCNITYTIAPTGPSLMVYNATSKYYEYNRTFSLPGTSSYTINCSAVNFANIKLTDPVVITWTSGYIPEFSTYAMLLALIIVISGFLFVQNSRVNKD